MKVTGKLKRAYVASRIQHHYPRSKSEFVNVNGANLHFVIRGTGQPIVLIHGNPGSCHDWSRLYGMLADHYCMFAFDRPGHGHSDRPNPGRSVTVSMQADLLRSALNQLQVKDPILVGHSWGGALALLYALRFQQEISGLVLLAPAAYPSGDGVSFLSKLPALPVVGDVLNFIFTPILSAWLVRTDLAKAFAPDKIPATYLRHTLAEWTRPKKVKWYSVDDALLESSLPATSLRYTNLTIPVEIITGDADLIVSPQENAHRLHESLANSRLTVLERTGHQVPFTRPDAVVEAIHRVVSTASLA